MGSRVVGSRVVGCRVVGSGVVGGGGVVGAGVVGSAINKKMTAMTSQGEIAHRTSSCWRDKDTTPVCLEDTTVQHSD